MENGLGDVHVQNAKPTQTLNCNVNGTSCTCLCSYTSVHLVQVRSCPRVWSMESLSKPEGTLHNSCIGILLNSQSRLCILTEVLWDVKLSCPRNIFFLLSLLGSDTLVFAALCYLYKSKIRKPTWPKSY